MEEVNVKAISNVFVIDFFPNKYEKRIREEIILTELIIIVFDLQNHLFLSF